MKIAAYQFKVSKNIDENFNNIKNAALKASKENIRLVVTQECALTGYPPIEINSINDIDFNKVNDYTQELYEISKELDIYIALGTIQKMDNGYLNSIIMISPDGNNKSYDKRALWGYDQDNFIPGKNENGIWEIDNIKIGIRICFEIRFPEYFRELYKEKVDIVIVSFCDISGKENPTRLNIIKSHLLTRAIENCNTIISVNGVTKYQTAHTCVIRPDGSIVAEAPLDQEYLLIYEYEPSKTNFGRNGRIFYNDQLLGIK